MSLSHSFDIDLATKYGVNEALIIHHFQHWIRINKKLKRNLHDGRTWSYQTLDEIAAHFPYLSRSEVFELIEKLCSGKGRRSKKGVEFEPVLIRGNFNKTKFDKTTWYAFADEKSFAILAQAKMEGDSSHNPDCPEPTPIPDTIPDAKPSSLSKDKQHAHDFELFGSSVKLKKGEYGELCEKHSKPKVDDTIEAMNDWISAKGKPSFKDYKAAINTWIRRTVSVSNQIARGNKIADRTQRDENGNPVVTGKERMF